jgi:hypothetical protein
MVLCSAGNRLDRRKYGLCIVCTYINVTPSPLIKPQHITSPRTKMYSRQRWLTSRGRINRTHLHPPRHTYNKQSQFKSFKSLPDLSMIRGFTMEFIRLQTGAYNHTSSISTQSTRGSSGGVNKKISILQDLDEQNTP